MAVPNIFATATSAIPLSQLDANFSYFTNQITVTSAVGVSISGTLGVTGATTLSGALTAGATGVTTLTASSSVTSATRLAVGNTGTSDALTTYTSTGGVLYIGLDNSAGSALGTAGAYGTVIYRPASTGFAISRAGTADLSISSTGVVNIPGGLNNTVLGATTPAAASVTTLTASSRVIATALTANGAEAIKTIGRAGSEDAQIAFYSIDGTTRQSFFNSDPSGLSWYDSAGAIRFKGTTTGLAVTGTLGATKNANAEQTFTLTNTTAGTAAGVRMDMVGNSGGGQLTFYQFNTSYTGTVFGLTASKLKAVFDNSITADSNGLAIGTSGDVPLYFIQNASERGRFDTGGNLLVGVTSPSIGTKLEINSSSGSAAALVAPAVGDYALYAHNKATSGDNAFINFGTEATFSSRGSITYNRAGGVVAYNTTSDYRAKDITGKYEASGETIDQLQVYMGKMKGATIARPMMIAHEAASVVPYAVTGEKDAEDEDGKPIYQSMDHQIFVPLLIAEVQALRSRVALLETK